MNIDVQYEDNYIVCKYGLTNNLERRTNEHINNYGKIDNVELRLMNYCYIDLKILFNNHKMEYQNNN